MSIRKNIIRDDAQGKCAAGRAAPTVLAVALAVGLGVAPLGSMAAEDAQRPYTSSQPGAQTGTDASGMKTARADKKMPAGIHKASKLIGYDVKNAQGDDIGDVKDLALDTAQGRVVYAVVSTGGIMGVGGQLHAVPLDAFDSQGADDALVLNATKEQLSAASGFDDDNWPTSPTWRGEAGRAGTGMDSEGIGATASAGSIVKASEFMKKDLKSAGDEDLGDIKDLAINVQTGEIVYAVVERGGVMGMGEKLVAIPTDALSPASDDDAVIISATEEQLQNAPGFSDDNWPERAEFAQFETDTDQRRDAPPSMQDPMQPQTDPMEPRTAP